MIFPHAWGQLATRHFAAALGEETVVPLQVPVEGWRYDLGRSIEQLAAGMAAEIRTQQPEGPYALAGYSFAGAVAYEVAGQLRAAGAEVEWLGLVDAASPSAIHAHDQGPTWTTRVRRRIGGGLGSMVRDTQRLLRGWANDLRVMAHRPVRPVFDWAGAMTMMAAYAPRGHDVVTTVVRTTGTTGMPADLGWGSVHHGPLEVVAVPGDHESVLSEPVVTEVAASVADRLRAARRGLPPGAQELTPGSA
jgi:thioesterase domain-containing protein